MRLILLSAALLACTPAAAQLYTPPTIDTSSFATVSSLNALTATVTGKADTSSIPSMVLSNLPWASNIPGSETVAGAAGVGSTVRRGDAIQPRITRTASCTIVFASSIGSCDATWDGSPFAAGTTIRLAGAPAITTATQGVAGEQPTTCKAYGITITGISFRCWTSQTTVLNLAGITAGLTLAPVTGAASGIVVQITAIPTS